MPWSRVLGHDAIQEKLRRTVASGRLASTFLFVGPAGIGKRTFALQFAKSLLCRVNPASALEACDQCTDCQQVDAGTHPDLQLLGKPADKSFIPLELLIGDDEHRMQEGLCHAISLKPFRGGRKIAILDDADYLNQEGANCLLKTLEEPPPLSVMILISASEQRQLPTIRSRCQIIRFQPLPQAQVEQLLLAAGTAATPEEARALAELSHGSLELARQYADESVREFRQRWLDYLAAADLRGFAFAKELITFVDAAGKEAPARRARLKQVARMAGTFYRSALAAACGFSHPRDRQLERAVSTTVHSPAFDADSLAECLDRCLEVETQVDANANQSTLIECWLDDLHQIQARAPLAVR